MIASLQSQGKIILANSELFDEMHRSAESTAAAARRMHFDAPAHTDDEEDKYKYVSPNVEDFDDGQDQALAQSRSARDVNANAQYGQINQQPTGNSSLTAQHSPSNNRSISQVSRHSTYRAVKPISTPLTAEEERELEELRQEELYQAKLRDKLKTESEEANNIYIPRLNLSDSENEEEKRITKLYKDSLDINLRDSLDDLSSRPTVSVYQQSYRQQDSRETSGINFAVPSQGVTEDADKQSKERAGLDSRGRAAIRMEMAAMSPPPMPQHAGVQMGEQTQTRIQLQQQVAAMAPQPQPQPQPQPPYEHGVPGPYPSDEQRLQSLVGPEQGVYPQPVMAVDGDVRLQQIFQEYGVPAGAFIPTMQYGMPGPPGGLNYDPQGYPGSYPSYNVAGYNQNPNGLPYNGPFGGQPFVINQGLNNVVQYPHGPPEELRPEPEQTEELNFYSESARRAKQGLPFQHSAMQHVRPGHTPAKPDVDHIQKNKERLYKPPSGKKYKNIHSVKKEVNKENVPGPSGSHRGSLPAAKSRVDSINNEDPETLWRRRSMSLADHKESRLSGGKKGHPGMKKYSSDSRVNGPHSNSRNAGHSQVSQPQAFTEPVRASVVPRQSDNGPVTHTMLTEDGQRISVDINLKMLSPTALNHVPATYYQSNFPNNHQRNMYSDKTLSPHPRGYPNISPSHHYDNQNNPANFFQPQQRAALPPHDMFRPAHLQQHMMGHQAVHMTNMPSGFDQQMYPAQDMYLEDVYDNSGHNLNGAVKPSTPNSPYKVLPPIDSADSGKGRDLPDSPTDLKPVTSPGRDNKNQGSYMDAFKKQKSKHVEYKAYTLKDYRNINKDVRLAGLGPDVDSETLRERREKALRQQEYARQVQDRNRAVVKPGKIKVPEPEENDIATRRRVAIEYAKSVPKPKLRPRQEYSTENSPPRSQVPSQNNSAAPGGGLNTGRSTAGPRLSAAVKSGSEQNSRVQSGVEDAIDLEELQRRHQLEKQKADLIRQNIQGVS